MQTAWLRHHSTYTLSHSHNWEWFVLLFTLWVRLAFLQPGVPMSHRGGHGNAVNVSWGAHASSSTAICLPCFILFNYNVIPCSPEAFDLKSPDNIRMLFRIIIIPTILLMIHKSLSVIPHQGWNQIQVLLGEEWEEREYSGTSKESTYTTYLFSSFGLDLDFY